MCGCLKLSYTGGPSAAGVQIFYPVWFCTRAVMYSQVTERSFYTSIDALAGDGEELDIDLFSFLLHRT